MSASSSIWLRSHPDVLSRLVKQGKLGKKTGEGFYVGRRQAEARRDDLSRRRAQPLGRALIQPLLDEAERALNDKIVASADHVDAGVIFGTGFAPFRGGPLHYRRSEQAGTSAEAAAA